MESRFSLDQTVAGLLAQAEQANMPDLKELPLDQARAQYTEGVKLMSGAKIEVGKVSDRTITLDGRHLLIRTYLPQGCTLPVPGLVYFHGGGWVIGNLESHDNLCRTLSSQAGCAVVAVDYRLAPEHKFPAAIQDATDAFAWIRENGTELGVDTRSLAIGGDSAGGNLAAVVSHQLHPPDAPRLLVLFYPSTDMSMSCPSIRELASGYRLTEELIQWFVSQYLSDPSQRLDPRASPILIQDLQHMPATFMITAGFDPLKDEGKAFAEKLSAAGVSVEHVFFESMIHGFMNMSGILPQARAALTQAAGALRASLT